MNNTFKWSDFAFRAALCLLLLAATAVRFYALETASMWWDEIYTPMTSRYPWAFIRDWCRFIEIQPPYFYMAMKAVMACGSSDFALRLPFALCGVFSVYGVYILGRRLFNPSAGLAAAAFIAFNPTMIWLSRTLRIYTLLHLLYILSLIAFCKAYYENNKRAEISLYFVNFLLLILHYSTILIVGAEGFVLFVAICMKITGISFARVFRFALISLLSFVPSISFFTNSVVDGGWLKIKSDYWTVAVKVYAIFSDLLVYFDSKYSIVVLISFFVVSAALLLKKNRTFVLLFSSVVLPILVIILKRYDSHMFPSHLTFILIPFSLILASPLRLLKSTATVVVLTSAFVLTSTTYYFVYQQNDLYSIGSNDKRVFAQGIFKQMARDLPGRLSGNSIVPMEHDLPIFNAVTWYLDQFSSDNPLTKQHLDSDRSQTPIVFLEGFNSFATLAPDRETFFRSYPGLKELPNIGSFKTYAYNVSYTPFIFQPNKQTLLQLGAEPNDFYSHVSRLQNVMLFPFDDGRIIPTVNSDWTWFEIDITNSKPQELASAVCLFEVVNTGFGNRVEVDYRYDGGAWLQAGTSETSAMKTIMASMETTTPWKTLTLRVRIWCDVVTPLKGGGNLSSIGIKKMTFHLGPPASIYNMQNQALQDILPQHLSTSVVANQSITYGDNVAIQSAPDNPDWMFLTPKIYDQMATVRVRLQNPPEIAVYHPRANGPNSAVIVVRTGVPEKQVSGFQGVPDKWSPIGLAVPLKLDAEPGKEEEFEIRLYGGGQLWISNNAVFFK